MQLVAFLLISLTAVFTFGSALTIFGQEKEWLTYEDPFLGIKVQYPSDWTKNATESTVSFNKFDFDSGLEPGVKGYVFAVMLEDLPVSKNKRLDQMVRDTVGPLRQFPEFELLEYSKTATLAGLPAYKVTWVAPYENILFLKIVNYFVIKENTGYAVSYAVIDQKKDSLDKTLQSQMPTFQKMLDSFTIN